MVHARDHSVFARLAASAMMAISVISNAHAQSAPSTFSDHPAAAEIGRLFATPPAFSGTLKPTELTRKSYLTLIAANVDHFAKHQDASGAIIDPVSKGERQYSTPAFALAAGLLVAEARRADLLEPATRAMTFATRQLAAGKSADGHADFYTPMLMHARRILRPHVAADMAANWDADLTSIEPEKIYNMRLKGMNWNLVSSCGEFLRRQDGLVPADRMDAQLHYLEDRLADHARSFTSLGMYADPGLPLAYDAFARLWLDDLMANGAYDGKSAAAIETFLINGGLSNLLLISPTGEWPSGGRSSHHNWCEAQAAAICEMHATRWLKAGRPDVAGAFKRAARLSLASMQRWQRPSGELNIIKNRYEPEKRFAYEGYSNHSQYNLLPMAMLAIAYQHADDSIAEVPLPSESGAYVFDCREPFHKVVAAAGGYYVLIETAGDPHYNATGLQRVDRAGVLHSPLTDSATAHRGYGKNDGPSQDLVPGLQWKHMADANSWASLGNAFLADPKKSADQQPLAVREASLQNAKAAGETATFELSWSVAGGGFEKHEWYELSPVGVRVSERLKASAASSVRLALPVTTFDGVDAANVDIADNGATVRFRGSTLRWTIDTPLLAPPRLDEAKSAAHPGLLQAILADLPGDAREASWTITLE